MIFRFALHGRMWVTSDDETLITTYWSGVKWGISSFQGRLFSSYRGQLRTYCIAWNEL